MKKPRTIFVISIILISVSNCFASSISLEEALKKGLVKLNISGKGGYTGNVIRMKVDNTTSKPLDLKVEAGRRLDSKDSSDQDLLITRSEYFTLAPKQSKKLNIFGMCCQAHNNSPDSGSGFRVGRMADSNLVKLAGFIEKTNLSANHEAQNAVWVVSDNNPIESIDGESDAGKALQKYVSLITGKPLPNYSIKYQRSNGQAAFSNKPLEISGIFEYDLYSNGVATFGIYDSENRLVQIFFAERLQDQGHYTFKYSYSATGLPSGAYYAKLRVDGQLRKEMKFEF